MKGLLFLLLFLNLLVFIVCWGLVRELRLVGSAVERIRKMLAKNYKAEIEGAGE